MRSRLASPQASVDRVTLSPLMFVHTLLCPIFQYFKRPQARKPQAPISINVRAPSLSQSACKAALQAASFPGGDWIPRRPPPPSPSSVPNRSKRAPSAAPERHPPKVYVPVILAEERQLIFCAYGFEITRAPISYTIRLDPTGILLSEDSFSSKDFLGASLPLKKSRNELLERSQTVRTHNSHPQSVELDTWV